MSTTETAETTASSEQVEQTGRPRKTIGIELGALTGSPVWENHDRGKNWLAAINLDPRSPNGIGREFADKAHGRNFFYMLPEKWGVGTPVEFGADYYTGGGNKRSNRWYGVIVERTDNEVVFEKFQGPRTAVKAAEELRKELEQSRATAPASEKDIESMTLAELKTAAIAEINRFEEGDIEGLRDLVNNLKDEPEKEQSEKDPHER